MVKRLLASEKFRFLLIGGVNTLACYGLFVLLYFFLELDYLLAYVFAYLITLVIGYLLQRLVVFRSKDHVLWGFLRYSLVQAAAFAVNLGLLPFAVEVLLWEPLIAQAAVLLIIVVSTYFAHRYFSFRGKVKETTP